MADVVLASVTCSVQSRPVRSLLGDQRQLLASQLYQYQQLLSSALQQGLDDDVIDPLRQQINTLMGELEQNRLAIYQNTIAQLAGCAGDLERGVAAQESLQTLAQRFADVRGGFGDTVGAAQASGAILAQRRDAPERAPDDYQKLLAEAIAENMNYEVTEPLQETINDLMGRSRRTAWRSTRTPSLSVTLPSL